MEARGRYRISTKNGIDSLLQNFWQIFQASVAKDQFTRNSKTKMLLVSMAKSSYFL